MSKANIREIFLSIQGEGPYVGERQLFIRFCRCNLNCRYCDTDFELSKSTEYTPSQLIEKVNGYGKNFVLSLTGGEPLVSVDFLSEFLPLAKNSKHKIYLETNATLPENLNKIIDFTDVISADIKLESCTGQPQAEDKITEFFDIASQKEVFAKIVFNENITEEEINFATKLAIKNNILIILQPEMAENNFAVSTEVCEKIFDKFYSKYPNVRMIPQMHKFLNVR